MMKKVIVSIVVLLIFLGLVACNSNVIQVPVETSGAETALPAGTSYPVHFNESFVNRYCYDALENENVYCGYVKDSNNLIDYDISWLSKKTFLDGSETYWEDLDMETILHDDEILFPVNRKFCEKIKNESVQMYAGLWCECYELNDKAFYIDINDAFNHFKEDTQLRFSSTPYYSNILSGISFGDTKIYELLQSGEEFKPYPSAYLHFPSNADYLREKTIEEEWIEHYYLIADVNYHGSERYYDYSLLIEFTETEKGYFVTITPNEIDDLNLPSEITDYVHIVAHGYILK